VHCTKISAEFEFGGQPPPGTHPQNVALGYDVGKISTCCLVTTINRWNEIVTNDRISIFTAVTLNLTRWPWHANLSMHAFMSRMKFLGKAFKS